MKVLDAAAVIAFMRDEPAADHVATMLEDRSDRTVISAVNLGEVVDKLARLGGRSPASVLDRLLWLRAGGLDVLFVDDAIGEAAGQLRARHYARETSALSMADCIALATARREAASLATLDAALARAARAEGVEVIGLPDSTGNRP